MPISKAYELPDKKKFPELYKKAGGLFSKNTKKLGDAIANYARENMSPNEAKKILNFLDIQGRKELSFSQIKEDLPNMCSNGWVREVEFILALQGGEIEKKDILKLKTSFLSSEQHRSTIWKAASEKNKNFLLLIGETMQDAGTPITKQDIVKTRMFYKSSGENGRAKDFHGRVIVVAAMNGNLNQVKAVVEINGEKLGKKDLMHSISYDEASENFHSVTNESIAFTALKNGQLDVVEQILTDEETFLCVKDVLNNFMKSKYISDESLGELLISPVFKDTSENIEKMWKELPDRFKTSTENQKSYKTALSKVACSEHKKELAAKTKNAAKALNKGGVAAALKKTGAIR